MLEWRIGDVKLTAIVEMTVSGNNEFVFPVAHKELCAPIEWLKPHFMDHEGNLIFAVQAFVIDTGKRKILIDTCVGNDKETGIPDWDNMSTPFLEDLEKAGYPAALIDTVFCTHLHVDHVGWNTRLENGSWVPTFANARYLFAREEWEHWSANEDDPEFALVMKQSIKPIVDAGLMDLVEWDHEICPEVSFEPTPGHTPGHTSVLIRSKGDEALITGDCMHHPVQLTKPDWGSAADVDAPHAFETRKKLFSKYVDTSTLIVGTHFPAPTAGRIKPLDELGCYWLDTSI